MVGRLIRGSAIAVGAASVVGFGIGLAVDPSEKTVLPAARRLPVDLCARLGEIKPLMPAKVELEQTGRNDVRCRAEVDDKHLPTYTWAKLSVTASTYAAKIGRTADDEARRVIDGKPWEPVVGRTYHTKISRDPRRDQTTAISVMVQRADTIVQVDYEAYPADEKLAEQAVLALADRAIWEAK